jgi:putative DNA methylase
MAVKKLIEVALPLEKINAESAREKSIRFGHPSTLHLWWARRPLAAARAVIWSSLVDDPSSHPELFPTEEAQNRERQRLFKILENLVMWENSNNKDVLDAAKAEILKSTNNNPPALLDPFAGGGAIPLEAQRLGLEAHAHDLNPVAVMINKAMIEIPPKFADMPPVNPDAQVNAMRGAWPRATGLAEDVRYYGEWMKQEAYKRIGHLYPKVKVPQEQGGGEATVIAWIWARTVKCPNPACGCEMPLISSFVLSKKAGKEAWIEPSFDGNQFHYSVKYGKYNKELENGTKQGKKAQFICWACKNGLANGEYIDAEANNGKMGMVLTAVVAEGRNGRIYLSPNEIESKGLLSDIDNYYISHDIDEKVSHAKCRGTFASNAQGRYYGFHEFKDYFTRRQLIALTTFSELVTEAQKRAEADATQVGIKNDYISLCDGGLGAKAYAEAVGVYLTLGISRMADIDNSLCSWEVTKTQVRHLFTRQAVPMLWDFGENNVFNNAAGDYITSLKSIIRVIEKFQASNVGIVNQADAQSDCGLREIMVSTDPPYYDNIGYADLSDFFYVWIRQSLKDSFPKLFGTMLVPKVEELIATPYRHNGSAEEAKQFFENGMLSTCKQIYKYAREDVPVTIYYAYKQSDTDTDTNTTASSGWETMLSAIINAGFTITGTWPMRTELANRPVGSGTNALASSIVLVCRKRPEDAPQTTRRNLIAILRKELRPALRELQNSNIAPVDLAQSAIGPGMGVFSRYRRVLEADGTPMSVRSALQVINEEIDLYFNEQVGDLDTASRFCVDLYTQNAYNEMRYGEAEVLANAKSTSIPMLAANGVLYAKAGMVHLIERDELPETVNPEEKNIWLLTQQLTRAMAKGGIEACAQIVFSMMGSNAERAKDLAYRLYTIAEQKKWTNEGYAYNALVVAWPDIQTRAAALKLEQPEQLNLFDL